MSVDVGDSIDKYNLLEQVGQGGMAVVYRAYDTTLKREVALKILHKHLAERVEAHARFEREAHAVAKLRHPNILEIYDFSGTKARESYIVTEFIDGTTLRHFMAENPKILPEIAAMITLQICEALTHAHEAGIVHRDIKPENVMIRRDGVLKLMDFGIAQMIDVTRMTATGQLLGSPAYMAPEHVQGKLIDHRTDIFAVGIVLYQLACGVLPFEGRNAHEVLKRIAECAYTPPERKNPKVAKALSTIICTALSEKPEERYQSILDTKNALESFLLDSGCDQPEQELTRYFRNPAEHQKEFEANLVSHLHQRGKSQLSDAPSAALESFNRVLALVPEHRDVRAIVSNIATRKTRRKRLYWASALFVALPLIAIGAITIKQNQSETSASRLIDAPAVAQKVSSVPNLVAAPRSTASLVSPSVLPQDAAVLEPPGEPKTPDDNSSETRREVKPLVRGTALRQSRNRVQAPTSPADTLNPKEVSVTIGPYKGAEYRVDQGPWKPMTTTPMRLDVKESSIIQARNPTCCESKKVRVAAYPRGSIHIPLSFLPAKLTTRCNLKGTQVRIDGKEKAINEDATIIIGSATGTENVTVTFFNKDRVDEQRVTLRADQERGVTCKF